MVSMEDLISQYFTETSKGNASERKRNEMKLLGVKGIGSAVKRYIDKDDKDSIGCIVDKQLEKSIDRLMSIDDMEDEQVDDQLMFFKQEREEEKAEAALDAPDRRARVHTSMQSDDRDAN